MPSSELIRAHLLAGRPSAAVAEAIEVHGAEVLSYLVGRLRSRQLAEDAFQDFCEALLRNIGGFRWECDLRIWLYRLARSVCSKEFRDPRRRRQRSLLSSEEERIPAHAARSVTATWRKTESRARLSEELDRLSDSDRHLVQLRLEHGLSWLDIVRVLADAGGADEASVRPRAAALRKRYERLKTQIKGKVLQDAD